MNDTTLGKLLSPPFEARTIAGLERDLAAARLRIEAQHVEIRRLRDALIEIERQGDLVCSGKLYMGAASGVGNCLAQIARAALTAKDTP